MTGGHAKLRKLLISNKNFLHQLYKAKSGHTNKRRLQRASPAQLKVVLRVLFCLERGHIEMWPRHYDILYKSKRLNKLLKLRKDLRGLLKASKEEQLKFLNQFCALYNALFYPLFNIE